MREEHGTQQDGEMKVGWRSTGSEDQAGDLSTMGKVRGNQTFSTEAEDLCVFQWIEILPRILGSASSQ